MDQCLWNWNFGLETFCDQGNVELIFVLVLDYVNRKHQ